MGKLSPLRSFIGFSGDSRPDGGDENPELVMHIGENRGIRPQTFENNPLPSPSFDVSSNTTGQVVEVLELNFPKQRELLQA